MNSRLVVCSGLSFRAGSSGVISVVCCCPAGIVHNGYCSQSLRRVREGLLCVGMLLAGGAVHLYLPLRAALIPAETGGIQMPCRVVSGTVAERISEEPHSRVISLLLEQLVLLISP